MIGLYLLAAHMVGDYLLQSHRMASLKLTNSRVRAEHVTAYCLPFLLVLAAARPGWRDALVFLALLWGYHFATDSGRAKANPADWFEHRVVRRSKEPLEPNSWPPLPIVVDQTLHLVQLAVLGGFYLT